MDLNKENIRDTVDSIIKSGIDFLKPILKLHPSRMRTIYFNGLPTTITDVIYKSLAEKIAIEPIIKEFPFNSNLLRALLSFNAGFQLYWKLHSIEKSDEYFYRTGVICTTI